MAFTDVNIGAVADDGTGDPLRTAFQKINGNFANAQTQLNTKAGSQETQDALAGQQAQLDEKASLESFDNLTQRVQENATAINVVRYASDLHQAAINNLQEQVAQAGEVEIATQTDIADGTEGKVVDAAGLKTAGITAEALGNNAAAIIALQNDTPRISAENFAVGTYALVVNIATSTILEAGSIYSGIYLSAATFYMDTLGGTIPSLGYGGTLSGSWRIMGVSIKARSSNMYFVGLAKRVA